MFTLRTKKILRRYVGSPKSWPHWRVEFQIDIETAIPHVVWSILYGQTACPSKHMVAKSFGGRVATQASRPPIGWQTLLRRETCRNE